jgi:hypothetical protein|tara:strand:+ start:1629 stop:2168 length:540 start_codon:yes stop_codon:yes gene_type:complete
MNRVDIIERVNQHQQLHEYWKDVVRIHKIGENRLRKNVIYRHAFMVAAKEISGLTLAAIGNMLERDHSSVKYAQNSHEGNFRFDKTYAKVYSMIRMDISDILVTDIDYYSQEGLKEENKELRRRLMKLARMNRELIVNRNLHTESMVVLKGVVKQAQDDLRHEQYRNKELSKKISSIAW